MCAVVVSGDVDHREPRRQRSANRAPTATSGCPRLRRRGQCAAGARLRHYRGRRCTPTIPGDDEATTETPTPALLATRDLAGVELYVFGADAVTLRRAACVNQGRRRRAAVM
jgi:hypothetical protein